MAPPNLVDTSLYGDSYIANAYSRGLTVYAPQTTEAERFVNTLGFYGKTGSVDHSVAKIQTSALDATRKGKLQILMNAGDAADAEFEAMKVDAAGSFAVQAYENGAAVSNLSLSSSGDLVVRQKIQAQILEAITELKGPQFDAIGTTVTLGSNADAQFQMDTSAKKVTVGSTASGDVFVVDVPAKLATASNLSVNGEFKSGLDALQASELNHTSDLFKVVHKASGKKMEYNIGSSAPGFFVDALANGSNKASSFGLYDGKVEMLAPDAVTSVNKGFKMDHNVGQVDIDYNLVLGGNLTVNGTMTTIESTTVTVADKTLELSKTADPTHTTAINSGIEITYPGGNKSVLFTEPDAADANKFAAFSANVGYNIPSLYAYQIDGQKAMTKDFVNIQEAAGQYQIAGATILTKSELNLASDASGSAHVQIGDWKLVQDPANGNFFIKKYVGGAWVTKAQYV